MTQLSAIKQTFVSTKIDAALSKVGLPVTSPLRALIERDAEASDGRDPWVYVARPDRNLTLDERVDELRSDKMFAHHFPKRAPTVDKRDIAKLSENFDAIASGKTIVS